MGNVPGSDASSYQRTPLDDYPGNVRHSYNNHPSVGGRGAASSNYPPQERSQSMASANSTLSESDAGRLERAAALEAKLTKKRPKPKDLAAIKDAHWKRYNELDRNASESAASSSVSPAASSPAQPAVGYRLADSAAVMRPTPGPTIAAMPGASPVAPASSPSPGLIPGINRSRAPPTAAQILSGQKRYETPEEAAIRAQRAAVFAMPAKQKQEKERNARDERYRTYAELEAQSASRPSAAAIVNAPLPFGFPTGDADYISQPSAPSPDDEEEQKSGVRAPHASSSSSSSSAASARPALQVQSGGGHMADLPPHFQQQMAYLVSKVRAMPPQSVSLLRKILQNLLKAGETPDANGAKFRRIKLANPKIQEAVVHTDGAMELLIAVGFAIDGETEEAYLQFPDGTPLDIAQLAYHELAVFSPTGAS